MTARPNQSTLWFLCLVLLAVIILFQMMPQMRSLDEVLTVEPQLVSKRNACCSTETSRLSTVNRTSSVRHNIVHHLSFLLAINCFSFSLLIDRHEKKMKVRTLVRCLTKIPFTEHHHHYFLSFICLQTNKRMKEKDEMNRWRNHQRNLQCNLLLMWAPIIILN